MRPVQYSALCVIFCLILPTAAWPQAAPTKLDFAPLLSTLRQKQWYGLRENALPDAVQAAFAQAQFQSAQGPGVLTLSIPDGIKKETDREKKEDDFTFTVLFSRDGAKQGEALESCPTNKLSECTDQIVLDTKTAESN